MQIVMKLMGTNSMEKYFYYTYGYKNPLCYSVKVIFLKRKAKSSKRELQRNLLFLLSVLGKLTFKKPL